MADAGVFEDAGTDTAENGDLVQQWNDQSGNGFNATQATSGIRPTYRTGQVNGLPAIEWFVSSANTVMTIPDNAAIEMTGDSTVFVVLKPNAASAPFSLLSKDNGASAGAYYLVLTTTHNQQLDRPFIEAGVPGTTSLSTSVYSVIDTVVSGTAVSHFINGAAAGTDTLSSSGTATNTPLKVGIFNVTTDPMRGFLAEILVYNAALNSTDRQQAEDYLGAKYNISIA